MTYENDKFQVLKSMKVPDDLNQMALFMCFRMSACQEFIRLG